MTLASLTFEWDVLSRILALAAAAGLDLPVFLVAPWLLSLLPWVALPGPGVLGGLDSPAPAMLGCALLTGWLLVRRLPVVGTALGLLLGGAGVIVAALLPWLLAPGGGFRLLESLAAIVVSGAIVGVRVGWRFIHAHPPATLPGSEFVRLRGWLLSGLAGALVVGTLVAPGAAGLAALGMLALALWVGRGSLRASVFALGSIFRQEGGRGRVPPAWALEGVDTAAPGAPDAPPSNDGPRGMEAALLGYGGGGLRPGWLIEGIAGDDSLCFRYRTPGGSWDLDLSGADNEEIEPGPLVHVRSITREGARYVLLLPSGLVAASIRSTDPTQRNL